MASIVPHGKRFRAHVCVKGIRESELFDTRTEAKAWAAAREADLRQQGPTARITIRELADRWVKRYSQRPSIDWEEKRLKGILKGDLGDLKLTEFNQVHAAKWRDDRLGQVQAGTVLREWNLLSSVFTDAVKEMGLATSNPFHGLRRPTPPEPRSRVATDLELKTLELFAATRPSGQVALQMFKLGIQTGMSVGELCRLNHEDIEWDRRVIRVAPFKTRPAREVPLTSAAAAIIGQGVGSVFNQHETNVDRNWRNLCKVSAIEDLHFHDSRHMAATWMANKIDPLALAKLLGHRDLKQLLNTYYKADASSLVEKLEG